MNEQNRMVVDRIIARYKNKKDNYPIEINKIKCEYCGAINRNNSLECIKCGAALPITLKTKRINIRMEHISGTSYTTPLIKNNTGIQEYQ